MSGKVELLNDIEVEELIELTKKANHDREAKAYWMGSSEGTISFWWRNKRIPTRGGRLYLELLRTAFAMNAASYKNLIMTPKKRKRQKIIKI